MNISFFIFSVFILIAFIVLFFYNEYLKSLFKGKKIYIENTIEEIKSNNYNEIKMTDLPVNIRKLISDIIFETGLPIYGIYEKEGVICILLLFTENNEEDTILFVNKMMPFLKKKNMQLHNKLKIIIPKDNQKNILKLVKKSTFIGNSNIFNNYIIYI